MPRENFLTVALARLARIPFALSGRRSFEPPRKALILQDCCLSQVMLATPLLAALSIEFPETRFDWAISDWARPAIASNPRLTELISTGEGSMQRRSWSQIGQLVKRLRREQYDTCFIPSRSGILSYIAWQAGIRQRVGLLVSSRGFAQTLAVSPAKDNKNAATRGLALAREIGVNEGTINRVGMEFYPADRNRLAVTQRLVEDIDWLGNVPLVIMHPGGGENPKHSTPAKRWPVERFVRLGNHVNREHNAQVVLVGAKDERALTQTIAGLMATKVADLSGQLSLGELGALCEVADLYVGNDAGPSHVAAASGCPTLVIFGPSDPALSTPYMPQGNVVAVWRDLGEVEEERPFTWEIGATAAQVIEAADGLLERTAERQKGFALLIGDGQ